MLLRVLLGVAPVAASGAAPAQLVPLNIDKGSVVMAGLGHSADFAHQFHVAFSSMVSGACVFSGQPFNCATTRFSQDKLFPKKDHCKRTPDVVDVGSLVDYPRRHCGQNPISIQECFDDVDYVKDSRVFAFRGTHDNVSAPGAVENTVALLAQMMTDPGHAIKLVTDQPFGFEIPLKSTPHWGGSEPAGYDGPGECLRHVYDAPLVAGGADPSHWATFDQAEFFDKDIGFQKLGWVYVPEKCEAGGSASCRLVVRPDTCAPPDSFAPDMAGFANYSEANGIVLLCPCTQGELDVEGKLSSDYVQQSAPQMRAIGKMVRRILGTAAAAAAPLTAAAASERSAGVPPPAPVEAPAAAGGALPTLNIDRSSILTAGCSNTADFAHQLHVAFSSLITGSCIFSGMPYHCAVTRFPQDYMVARAPSTAAGIHCPDCDDNGTLIYDHCKNHPKWVDVNMLAKYAETAADVDDPKTNLANARVFSFGPTHDRCYQPPAMENIANFHLLYAKDKSQVKLVEDQPFPHTLPTNGTPYFNNVSNHTGAGYDGPGECLKHVIGNGTRLYPASSLSSGLWRRIDVSEFVTDTGVGVKQSAWLFVPPQCDAGVCKLLILPGGCGVTAPSGGSDGDFARYGLANDMVILKPCQGGGIDKKRFPQNHENLRGMVDVYGQLSANYATQKGDQMAPIGKMLKRLLGVA